MEANTLAGGMLPGGMLGLEMPLHNPHHQQQHHPPPPSTHPHHQQQQQQSYPHHQNHPHLSMVAFNTHESDPHSQSQQSVKQNNYPFANKPKQQPQQQQHQQQQLALSDEEEHGFNGEDGSEGRKRVSPWQRVKWTDNMVKLLILVVFYVGDDTGPEGNDSSKKKGGLLQKKGKWKSVSRAMMEKGFYVSPQQCEDKFNDLNKRYKRVNDILGKGIACRVVENQALLESMDQLSPKMKEEVRKLLNSKHLFFREMCYYHTNGGGGGGGGGERVGAHQVSDVAVEPSTHHQQQQRCFHSSQNNVGNVNLRNRVDTDGLKMAKRGGGGGVREHEDDADGEEDDNEEEEDEEDEDDDEEEEIENGVRDCGKGLKLYGGHEEEDDEYKSPRKKRQRRGGMFSSPLVQQLSCELMNVVQDGSKSPWEQRQWMRSRSLQLEEQRVNYQCKAFELEKQRLKWIKFSMEKERDLERMKLNNERMRLDNERMVLLLRQKELELFDHHQQQHSSSKRPEPSSMTG